MLPRDTNAHGTIFGGVILTISIWPGHRRARLAPRKFVTRAMRGRVHCAGIVGDVVSLYVRCSAKERLLYS
jgi:acyl-CoA thioesterase YciA